MGKHDALRKALEPKPEPEPGAPLDFGDIEVDLLKTLDGGRRYPVCACGGRCVPTNCWNTISYWRCVDCSHRYYDGPPEVTAPSKPLELAELKAMLDRIKRAVESGRRDQ